PDEPCWVVLSASGRLLRTKDRTPLKRQGRRRRHDVYTAVVATTARGEIGALTDTGRLIRLNAVEVPALTESNDTQAMSDELEATATPAMYDVVKAYVCDTIQIGEKMISIVP